MIKSTDLMIGDLVYYSEPNQYLTRVDEIRQTADNQPLYYIAGKRDPKDPIQVEDVNLFACDILCPIPITPDILEKNGFVRREDLVKSFSDALPFFFELSTEKEYVSIVVEWLDSYDDGESSWEEYWSISVENGLSKVYIKNKVVYVHQLQQAMRLCDIRKEIVL